MNGGLSYLCCMKIALLTDGVFPYVVGGMQKHSLLFCRYLVKAGHHVLLIHTSAYDQQPQAIALDIFTEAEKSKIESIYLDFPQLPKFPLHYIIENYFFSKNIGKKYWDQIQSCDLIYAQGLTGWWLSGISRAKRPKLVVNLHGLEMFQQPASRRDALIHALIRPFFRNALRRADGVQSLGGKLTSLLIGQGISRDKIFEVGIGINSEWLRTAPIVTPPTTAPRRLAFVGRYERRKGVQELSEALKILEKENILFEMNFIGPIPDEMKIHTPAIIYHGAIREVEKIQSILQNVDILVCPSYSEGMPTVILEAMASGCAIVATDVGATAMLVDDKNGQLIEAGDLQALKRALTTMLQTPPDQLTAMKTTSIQRIKTSFCWEQVVTHTIQQIDKIA